MTIQQRVPWGKDMTMCNCLGEGIAREECSSLSGVI